MQNGNSKNTEQPKQPKHTSFHKSLTDQHVSSVGSIAAWDAKRYQDGSLRLAHSFVKSLS